jgi:hypothetical protein
LGLFLGAIQSPSAGEAFSLAFFRFFPCLAFFPMAINLDPCRMEPLTQLFGSIIAVNNRKFIKSDTPGGILGSSLISERPDEFEGHSIGAFLALGKCLPLKKGDFMGQAMSRVKNTVDPTGGNHRTRLEDTPMHWKAV